MDKDVISEFENLKIKNHCPIDERLSLVSRMVFAQIR